ncbi:hypothetical protein Tco_1361983 [Tanacetum coccineum]
MSITSIAMPPVLVRHARSLSIADFPEGKVGQEMDLFSVVYLSKPKLVTEGVRPLRYGEEPLLESTAGRTMELVLEQPEFDSTDVLAPTPLRSVPGANEEPPRLDTTSVGSSEDADVAGAESEVGEVDSGLKRKRATSDDGAGLSKRVRHVSLGLSTSTEEETPDAPPTLAAKEVTRTSSPEYVIFSSMSVMSRLLAIPLRTGDRMTAQFTTPEIVPHCCEISRKASGGQQAALVAQLRARFSSERSQSVQKDEEILLLKTQLVNAQAEAESSSSANSADYKASCHWAVKYLEGGKNNHFARLDEFRQRVEGLLEKQEEKLRKLSIKYDEELYPHMLSAIAERRWLISHGLRLAAMSTLESQEVKQSFGDVVKCAWILIRRYEEACCCDGGDEIVRLPPFCQLERDKDYPIDVVMAGLTLARHGQRGRWRPADYFLSRTFGATAQVPIYCPRDILNPFALEKEIPLKESLEAHAIRLAKKKGVKGKAILCGVGAAHIPRSDGVPVSVATVSPKDSELLGKLEEAGDAAYQVGSSEQSRCHSI